MRAGATSCSTHPLPAELTYYRSRAKQPRREQGACGQLSCWWQIPCQRPKTSWDNDFGKVFVQGSWDACMESVGASRACRGQYLLLSLQLMSHRQCCHHRRQGNPQVTTEPSRRIAAKASSVAPAAHSSADLALRCCHHRRLQSPRIRQSHH